jgi:SAM-dependent methyltransferase
VKEFWNERYASEDYAYGVDPNVFFKNWIDQQTPGKILLPAEGEGRNAVYAARKGWEVFAFDYSESGKDKAALLAKKHGVAITFEVADATAYDPGQTFDAIVLIYAHFPPPIRSSFHKKVVDWLKPGGFVILEAYNKKQLGNGTGGPKNIDFLLDETILRTEFDGLNILNIENKTLHIEEGLYHKGTSDVIRMVAAK